MRTLRVIRVVEALDDQRPLDGDVIGGAPGYGQGLVDTPAGGAMVDDDIPAFV
ncbi:MAG: hypothetical protein ACYTF1_15735 [Planctomycetota bacterium]